MNFGRDLTYGLRSLLASPGSTAAAVASLSLVIGLTTAVFGFLNAVLLRPFPYPASEQLVVVWGSRSFEERVGLNGDTLDHWRQGSSTVDDVAPFQLSPYHFSLGGSADSVNGAMVGTRIFSLLRVNPFLGRVFTAAEEVEERSVILSHALWEARFGGDPTIIGRQISVNGTNHTVVGVMPPDFFFPDIDRALWVPLTRRSSVFSQVHGLARLRPGATVREAQAEATSVLNASVSEHDRGSGAGVFPLHRLIIRDYDTASWALFAAAILLVLAACANVSNLLLARRLSKAKELAVRVSLGATRRDVITMLLVEPLILSLGAGAVGVVFAQGTITVLRRLHLIDIPRVDAVAVDAPVLIFALGLSLATAIASGLIPAITLAWSKPAHALQQVGHATSSRRSLQIRFLLLALQVAVTSVLLVGAGLLAASFVLRSRSDWGFQPTNVLVAEITLPVAVAKVEPARNAAIADAIDRLAQLPAVRSVAMASGVPVKWTQWRIARLAVNGRLMSDFTASSWTVSEGYFRALGIPVLRGREFDPSDAPERRVVISKALAERLWPGENPIGRRVTTVRPTKEMEQRAREVRDKGLSLRNLSLIFSDDMWEADGPAWEVIGEVGNVRMFGLESSPPPAMYVHYRQDSTATLRQLKFVVRTAGDPNTSVALIKEQITAADPSTQFDGSATMEDIMSRSVGGRGSNKLLFLVSAAVSALSLLIAALGIYGVTVFTLQQRMRDIGIRRALGARPVAVVRSIVDDVVRALLLGLVVGLAGAAALTGVLKRFLFGVTPMDGRAFAAVVVLMCAAACMAALRPAARALKVNPAETLRQE